MQQGCVEPIDRCVGCFGSMWLVYVHGKLSPEQSQFYCVLSVNELFESYHTALSHPKSSHNNNDQSKATLSCTIFQNAEKSRDQESSSY